MHLRALIGAAKSQIRVGEWRNGKVPRASFPLARKAYRLGSAFEWCVITFHALGHECRVLVIVNVAKESFKAIVGVVDEDTIRVLCSYEFHPDVHTGWHCHACCDDTSDIPTGLMRGPWVRRLPGARRTHRRQNFGIDGRSEAVRAAVDCYHLFEKGPLL